MFMKRCPRSACRKPEVRSWYHLPWCMISYGHSAKLRKAVREENASRLITAVKIRTPSHTGSMGEG